MVITDIYDAWRSQDLDRLARYLPDDFCHVIYIPTEIHPLGGISNGKRASIERLGLIARDFDFLNFDTRDLIIQKERAGVEIPVCYRHRQTGAVLETKIANFWTSRRAGQSCSPNIMTSAASKPSPRSWLR
ncbi:MAG: nuclear transport factor 2 family protein [Actinomycetota bacterium]